MNIDGLIYILNKYFSIPLEPLKVNKLSQGEGIITEIQNEILFQQRQKNENNIEENEMIYEQYLHFGPNWNKIAQYFPNLNPSSVKSKFESFMFEKTKKEIQTFVH